MVIGGLCRWRDLAMTSINTPLGSAVMKRCWPIGSQQAAG
jgi:hypothetical protein